MLAQTNKELTKWLGEPIGHRLDYQLTYHIGIISLDNILKGKERKGNNVILNPRQFGLEIHVVQGILKQYRFGLSFTEILGWGITAPNHNYSNTLLIEYIDLVSKENLAIFLKCKDVQKVELFMKAVLPNKQKVFS